MTSQGRAQCQTRSQGQESGEALISACTGRPCRDTKRVVPESRVKLSKSFRHPRLRGHPLEFLVQHVGGHTCLPERFEHDRLLEVRRGPSSRASRAAWPPRTVGRRHKPAPGPYGSQGLPGTTQEEHISATARSVASDPGARQRHVQPGRKLKGPFSFWRTAPWSTSPPSNA